MWKYLFISNSVYERWGTAQVMKFEGGPGAQTF